MTTLTFAGTGGNWAGSAGASNVNVNLDGVLEFDGTGDYIDCGTGMCTALGDNYAGNITLSLWLRANETNSNDGVIAIGTTLSNDDGIIVVKLEGNVLKFGLNQGGWKRTIPFTQTNANRSWHHLMCVYKTGSEANSKIYLDGVETAGSTTGSFPAASTFDFNSSGTKKLIIGAYYSSSLTYDGQIADVRIYNNDLGADEARILASRIGVPNTAVQSGSADTRIAHYDLRFSDSTSTCAETVTSGDETDDNIDTSEYRNFTNGDYVLIDDEIIGPLSAVGDSGNLVGIPAGSTGRALFGTSTAEHTSGDKIFIANMDDLSTNSNLPTLVGDLTTPSGDIAWDAFSINAMDSSYKEDIAKNVNGTEFASSTTAVTFEAEASHTIAVGMIIEIGTEKMYVSGVSTNDITVTRGIDGTTAANQANGSDIYSSSANHVAGTMTVTSGILEGKSLSSFNFDGDDDYVVAPTPVLSATHTVSCWFKADALESLAFLFGNGSGSDIDTPTNGWNLYLRDPAGGGTAVFGAGVEGGTVNFTSITGGIEVDKWYHLIWTADGALHNMYLDGVRRTEDYSGTAIEAQTQTVYMGLSNTCAGETPFDGKLRDVRIYKQALSPAQATALYSGNYNVIPDYWWKLDEGSGGTSDDLEDSGTAASDADGDGRGGGSPPSFVNSTLDLDSTLTIAANGTLSMPRGELELSGQLDINCTTVADQFIHNNGTFSPIPIATALNLYTGGATFYNVHRTSGDSEYVYQQENCTILKRLYANDYIAWAVTNAATLTLGDSNTQCTVDGSQYIQFSSANAKIYGGDQLKPALIQCASGIQFGTFSQNIKWLDIQVTESTGGSGRTVVLDGDCEFDAVTVSSGDTLDINGQRIECSGAFVNEGTTNWGGAGALHIAKMFTINGDNDEEAGANFIVTGSSAGDNMDFDDASFVADATSNILINNGTTSVDWDTSESYAGNLIVGSPMISIHGTKNKCGNLTIPTGGNLDMDNDTLTVAGDFTTSGGLLGTSCLTLNGSDEYGAVGGTTWGFGDAWTVEMWFKTSQDSQMTLFDLHNDSTNDNRIRLLVKSSDDYMYLQTYDDGTPTENTISAPIDVIDGKWHHVAATSSGTVLQLYIDGKLMTETTATVDRAADPTMQLRFGRLHTSSAEFFNGSIDELRIWSAVRTETEIRANMFKSGYANLSNNGALQAAYDFDEGTTSTAACLEDGSPTTARNLLLYDGGGLETAGLWAGAGDFDGSHADCKITMTGAGKSLNYLSGEVLGQLLIDNSSGTVTASALTGTNNLTVTSLKVNDSSASFTAPAGTLTITGKNSGNYHIDIDGVFVHSGGTVKIDTSLTGDKLLDIIPSSGTGLNNLIINEDGSGGAQFNGNTTIAGDLTIEEGILSYYDSNNSELTVGGDVLIEAGGTLGAAGQTDAYEFGSLWISGSGIFIATQGVTTITSAKSNFAISNSGTFTHNGGTVTISGGSNQWLNNGPYYNLISNNDSSIGLGLSADVTVAKDLTINASKNLGWVSPQYTLTVTEDVVANGYLNKYNSASTTGACNFGSLAIADGGTYYATSGTTTITASGATGDAAKSWQNLETDGTGFVHNNGKVKFTYAGNTEIKENEFYDLEIAGGTTNEYNLRDTTGNAIKIYRDFTVTQGRVCTTTTTDTVDVYGNTHVAANGTCWHDADQATNTLTHHGLVTNLGIFKINDGTTIKLNGGIRQLNTLTID